MSIAAVHKGINAYADGGSYLGVIAEFEEPKITLSTEDFRNGGMLGPVKMATGVEALEANLTLSRNESRLIGKIGTGDIDGMRLRLVSAQQDTDGRTQAVEIYLTGAFTEFDPGKSKTGDKVEHKYKVSCVYYRRVVDGSTEIEINPRDGVFRVGGIDRHAEIMAILNG